MTAKPLLSDDDKLRVRDAIRAVESRTAGEVRVVVVRKTAQDPLETARKWFVKLGMEKTRDRNGVLICLGSESHTFAILGDDGIHRYLGDDGWSAVRDAMAERFRRGDFAEGIIYGVEETGRVLAEHFPPRADDKNELSDDVADETTDETAGK